MASSKFLITFALIFLISSATSSVIDPSERFLLGKLKGLKGIKCGWRRCKGNTVCAGKGWRKRCVVPMKLGGRCGQDPYWICSSGLSCSAGRCVKFMNAGGSCVDPFWKCQAGLVCNAHKICALPIKEVGLGESCANVKTTKCAAGLSCDSKICTKIVPKGSACEAPGLICEASTTCSGPAGTKTCKAVSNVGETCADLTKYDCAAGLKCDSKICTKIIHKGGKCVGLGLVCEAGLTCDGTCKATSSVGEICVDASKYVCAAGLKCDSKICTKIVPKGSGCQGAGLICATGSTCRGPAGTKTCKMVMDLGGSCADAAATECEKGLTCNGNICTKVVPYRARCSLPNIVCEPNKGLGCVGNGKNDFCLKLMGEGGSCIDPWWVCEKGLVCTPEGHKKICRRPRH